MMISNELSAISPLCAALFVKLTDNAVAAYALTGKAGERLGRDERGCHTRDDVRHRFSATP